MHFSAVLASLLCLATTQFATSVGAIKATSLKLRSNPNVDLKLTKRDYLSTTFRPNNETVFGFYVDVLVGTPPQFFSLAFSTSSTTWLPSPRNSTVKKFCDDNATGNEFWSCYYDNFYQPNKSSTYEPKRGVLDNYYGTGLFAKGTWGSDVFKINQLTIPNVSFGLANNFTSAAELGLGVDFARTFSPYPSLPELMAMEGSINLILYSIYINDIRNDGGEIFFGAIDEAKYEGTLTTFESNTVGRVYIKGVYFLDPDGTNSTLVDSEEIISTDVGDIQLGTPSLWVPNNVYRRLIEKVPVTYSTAYEAYTVDCSIADDDLGTVQFDLGDTIISVHTRQILVEYPTGSGTCVLTLYQSEKSRSSSPDFLLGTPFLRSAYTVFDYTNNRTSIAQSVFNSTSSTLREVPEGGIEAMPQRSGNPSGGTPTETPTMTPSTGPNISGTGSPTAIISTVPSKSDDGVPVAAIVGGSLGGVAALIIAGVITWLLVTRRRKNTGPEMPLPPDQGFPPPGPQDTGHTDPQLVGYKPAMTTTQHTYGVTAGQPSHPPSAHITSPPTSYHENWGNAGYAGAIQPTNNGRTASLVSGRPSSVVSGGAVSVISGSTGGGYGQDLSSFGGHPGQPGGQGGLPSPPLNATGVYGSYGYSGYNQY
ncbi:hypothetical protein TWF281_001556 [Arthrobotrys megalospora]